MNHLVPCPNCGEPFCPDCGEHHPGQVGAAPRSMVAKRWGDPSPYAVPGKTNPTWLDLAFNAFFKKAPENFYLYLKINDLQSHTPTNQQINFIATKLQWWMTHRWATATAWQNELGWADDPGGIMWPMFQLWWYGWDSPSRGKHYVKCSGQKPNEFWDPVTLQCSWD